MGDNLIELEDGGLDDAVELDEDAEDDDDEFEDDEEDEVEDDDVDDEADPLLVEFVLL